VHASPLVGAADEAEAALGALQRPGERDRAGVAPLDARHVDRLGQALQRDRAHGREAVVAATARHRPDQVGAEDLSAGCVLAQPGGLDDRESATVVTVERDVTDAEPDSYPLGVDTGAARLGRDPALDRDRGRDRVGRRRERCHHAVAQGLHDVASVRVDGVGEQGGVPAVARVCPFLAEHGADLGRVDEIREEHRGRSRYPTRVHASECTASIDRRDTDVR
jgi:hypothetical protein